MKPRLLLLMMALVALALACGHYDLDISRRLVDPTADWARLAERYGSLPGVYAIAASASLLQLRATPSGSPAQRAFLQILCAITLAVAGAVSAYRLLDRRLPLTIVAATAAALFGALEILRRRNVGWSISPEVERVSGAVLALGVWSWLIVNGLKAVWGRVRFRDLDATLSAFTPWYLPQGFTGHLSFPSGHTAMGWVLLPLLWLWPVGSRGFRRSALLIVGWGAFVAASRVVAGAHYASDVLFSTALAVALTLRLGSGATRRAK